MDLPHFTRRNTALSKMALPELNGLDEDQIPPHAKEDERFRLYLIMRSCLPGRPGTTCDVKPVFLRAPALKIQLHRLYVDSLPLKSWPAASERALARHG